MEKVTSNEMLNIADRVVCEDTALRTVNTETYVMENGDRKLICYSSDKYYKNPKRYDLVDVKNYLKTDNAMGIRYISDNDFRTEISLEPKDRCLYTLLKDNAIVSVKAVSGANNIATVDRVQIPPEDPGLYGSGDYSLSKRVTYPNVFGAASYVLCQQNKRVMNSIVIPEKLNCYDFSFELEYENATCFYKKRSKTLKIVKAASREVLFEINALGLIDSKGIAYNCIDMSFKRIDDKHGLIKFSCESSIFDNDKISFPANLIFSLEYHNFKRISTFAYGDNSNLLHQVSRDIDGDHGVRVHLDIPDIPKNASISNATLELVGPGNIEYEPRIAVFAADNSSKGTVKPIAEKSECDIDVSFSEKGAVYSIDITPFVRSEGKGKMSPIDLFVLPDGYGYQTCIYGSEAEEGNFRFTITYNDMPSNWEYCKEYDMGAFGNVKVNCKRGNTTMMINASSYYEMPIDIPMVLTYDSRSSDGFEYIEQPISHKIPAPEKGRVGRGWNMSHFCKMNVGMFVYKGKKFFGYMLLMPNGERIYFTENRALGTRNTIVDGYYDTYYIYSDFEGRGYHYNPITQILTYNGDVYKFNMLGYLESIERGEETVEFKYNNGFLRNIVDTWSYTLDFDYDVNGFLKRIDKSYGGSLLFTYNDGCLAKMEYKDGRKVIVTYTEDKEHLPTSITTIDGEGNITCRIKFKYHLSRVVQVTVDKRIQDGDYVQSTDDYHYEVQNGESSVSCFSEKSCEYVELDQKGRTIIRGGNKNG